MKMDRGVQGKVRFPVAEGKRACGCICRQTGAKLQDGFPWLRFEVLD